MISAVMNSDTSILGDSHDGVYIFAMSHKGETVASAKFELISDKKIESLDLSDDAYDADYELSLLLDISPPAEIWLLNQAKAAKGVDLAEFLLATMQMIARQNEAYEDARSYVAFIRPFGMFEDVWSQFESGLNNIVYAAKFVVALR